MMTPAYIAKQLTRFTEQQAMKAGGFSSTAQTLNKLKITYMEAYANWGTPVLIHRSEFRGRQGQVGVLKLSLMKNG